MTEDQRFAATRPDVLVYQTDPLTEDITVAGSIKPEPICFFQRHRFRLHREADRCFSGRLSISGNWKQTANGQPERMRPPQDSAGAILTPNGYEMLLRGEPMPARFRHSFETA